MFFPLPSEIRPKRHSGSPFSGFCWFWNHNCLQNDPPGKAHEPPLNHLLGPNHLPHTIGDQRVVNHAKKGPTGTKSVPKRDQRAVNHANLGSRFLSLVACICVDLRSICWGLNVGRLLVDCWLLFLFVSFFLFCGSVLQPINTSTNLLTRSTYTKNAHRVTPFNFQISFFVLKV
jgi:hypothetical protein